MKYDFDVLVIGLGPAGMAVAVMASEMGLKVCGIEKNRIGGECMNVGCIPSKALLRMAETRSLFGRLEQRGLAAVPAPAPTDTFARIQRHLEFISENKTLGMFKKVDLVLGEGGASFVDPHTVEVGARKISAKRVYVCTGTRPALPPIPGLAEARPLTNETVFALERLPESLLILGGGAIGCEMAQAFSRLGCRCSIVHMDPHLLPHADLSAGQALEEVFRREHIDVYNGRRITAVERTGGRVALRTAEGDDLAAEALLVAAGRAMEAGPLRLENAGVRAGPSGIVVNRRLQTAQRHVYAAGDCNGHALFSHAAMHQGMIALMNSLMPGGMDFRKFVVPWTVFTTPAVSQVGATERQLRERGAKFETVTCRYADYGAAIAEDVAEGHVRAYIGPAGRILGAQVIGEGSGEMINEWALAVQKKINITSLMMLQHSFPSMSFLNKRVAESWMMNRMKNPWLRRMARRMF